ncbi:hypothetical protein PHISCL_03677 [Aspergillus sclerotialis]|uniref:Rhodopsin domain-containing protein n=1 Tax=Aspergillus sclerotialis TaxID=2070753 RepID=A0A3A3A3N8_9EURO|nr:hypothetical protein PHISCL_03677 [Aspergillus sclerotialis]
MPAIMLRHLQVNRRVKASLICILSLGVFACAAAFVKLSILPNYGRTGDFLWDYTELTIWIVVECNTGIIAGSLPTLKPLFKKALGTYGSSKTRQYTSSRQYRLRSLSRSVPSGTQRHSRVGNTYGGGGLQESYRSPTRINQYANLEVENSSEENILPRKDGIMCTTEVAVVHSGELSTTSWSEQLGRKKGWI